MILILDNYDSFTFNLVQYIGEQNPNLKVIRNDQHAVAEVLAMRPSHIVISPGPCTPKEAGISIELIKNTPASIPLLGVCLGHQSLGEAFGGKVIRAPFPMHGKTDGIQCQSIGLFQGLPETFTATRYHSLIVERESLPSTLEVTATNKDNIIMGLKHKTLPLFGLQFHPESILTEHGKIMIANFLAMKGSV